MDQLPSWDALKTHYPNVDAGIVFTDIGGKVGLNYDMGVFKNACATRVSKALNGVGALIQYHFLKLLALMESMKPRFHLEDIGNGIFSASRCWCGT